MSITEYNYGGTINISSHGWTCSVCGRLIPHGVTHVCAYNPEPFPSLNRTPQQTQLGWECPRCHRVYSPHAKECWHCNNLVQQAEIDAEDKPPADSEGAHE